MSGKHRTLVSKSARNALVFGCIGHVLRNEPSLHSADVKIRLQRRPFWAFVPNPKDRRRLEPMKTVRADEPKPVYWQPFHEPKPVYWPPFNEPKPVFWQPVVVPEPVFWQPVVVPEPVFRRPVPVSYEPEAKRKPVRW